MAKKVNATQKENNVKENVEMTETVETVETTVNVENVKENVEMTETVETVETTAPVLETPATVEETAPVPTVEEIRINILEELKIINAKSEAVLSINKQGEKINATNWAKDETHNGNDTLGKFVRALINDYWEQKKRLKAELKATYYNVAPFIVEMLNYDNNYIKLLAHNSMERMSNVVILDKRFMVENKEIINILYNLGVAEIGVNAENMGYAMTNFTACGYQFNYLDPQPVTVEERKEQGLDPVPAYTYFSFKRVEKK